MIYLILIQCSSVPIRKTSAICPVRNLRKVPSQRTQETPQGLLTMWYLTDIQPGGEENYVTALSSVSLLCPTITELNDISRGGEMAEQKTRTKTSFTVNTNY